MIKGFFKLVFVVAIALGIAYHTGYLNGFTPADFQEAFTNITSSDKDPKYLFKPVKFKESQLRAAYSVNLFKKMINSNEKVVFYIYTDSQTDFHREVQRYLNSSVAQKYLVYSYPESSFKRISLGNGGTTSICNSIDECKAQHQKTADYNEISTFLRACGKTMCVINPQRKQYVRLTRKDATMAKSMLNYLRNW